MSVPAIALYASAPSTICSSYGFPDYDLNPRPPSSSISSSSGQKPIAGGLSCLFSSSSIRHASPAASSASFTCGDDRCEELGGSLSYYSHSSLKSRDQSPVSVFYGPASCSGSDVAAVGSCRSPSSLRVFRESSTCDLRAGKGRTFDGIIRNALGSCLSHDSPSTPLHSGGGFDMEDFTFNLEESCLEMGPSCDSYASELLAGAQSRHKIFTEEFVVKAFYEAEKAHRGQMRASGDPYLHHCVETAILLAKIGATSVVIAAGLLHDTLDDSSMDYDHILQKFGGDLADLVEGVSKLSQLSQLARVNNTASRTVEADRMHTMFLAMADARAVLIKLADRLHNMMTLDALPMIKQQRFAKETLEIFAPLANRLGISSWKVQLEDLCFKYLYPEQYKELSFKLLRCSDEAKIASAMEKLDQALRDGSVSYHVLSGRHKSLYSIYSKMLKKKLNMDEIHDIHGLRLIVETEEDCYRALNIVHQLWPEVLGRLKDYISHPKSNGYQSLHTVLMSEDIFPLEVQIRTKEMHLQAEFGFAAHWRYKEGECQYASCVLRMVEYARWVLSWQCETMNVDRPSSFGDADSIRPPCPFPTHSEDCPYSYTCRCDHDGPIFVILLEKDKMSVQEFPKNSTVMDLLERAEHRCPRLASRNFSVKEELRARISGEPVSDPDRKLKMGDVVELTPAIPDKYLTEYREEIQRMYNQGLSLSNQFRKKS